MPRIYSDDNRLSQILRNFISNGLKFTVQGEVRVTARCESPGWLTFAVADTGIGIASENLGKLFQDFVQVGAPAPNPMRGTGLGLSLSKRLAELLGGGVDVRSEPGRGSTFSVTIPNEFRVEEARPPDEAAVAEEAVAGEAVMAKDRTDVR